MNQNMIEGFCFHCRDCPENGIMDHWAMDHSKRNPTHGVMRRSRSNCQIHLNTIKSKGSV